jgi:hypothetical protein
MAAPITTIKPSWAGGEVSPELWGRVDLSKYGTWLKKCRNFLVQPSGDISNRPGLHVMAAAKHNNKKIKARKFIFSTLQAYELEFGEYYIRFYTVGTNAGQILKSDGTAWAAGTDYIENQIVNDSGIIYICLAAHTAGATLAGDILLGYWSVDIPAWATTTDYVVGDYVYESSTIYYCISPNNSGTFAVDLAAGDWIAQTIYEVPTPYDESDLQYLKFTQSADVLFVDHPDYSPRQLNRLGNANWTLTLYDFKGGPFQLPNTDESIQVQASATTGLGVSLTASAVTWITSHEYHVGDYVYDSVGGGHLTYQCITAHVSGATLAGDSANWVAKSLQLFYLTHGPNAATGNTGALWNLRHYVPGHDATTSLEEVSCGGTWRILTRGTWTGTFAVEKSTDGGLTWTNLRTFSGAGDININTYGTEDMSNNAPPFLMRVNVTAGSLSFDLTTDPFYQIGILKITSYVLPTQVVGDVVRPIASTDATLDWAEGAWSDYRGWPSVVEFNPQDRLMHANNYNQPMTCWMTKTGNYYDFSVSDPIVDDDGISVNLPSREVNGINNMVPLISLLVLTSSSEWSLGDPGTPITPTTVSQRVNGYEGSNGIDCAVIGNRAIYVQFQGALVCDLAYELYLYRFEGSDLSILARHLFAGYSIVGMDYEKYPGKIVWCVRSDGKLLAMTYMREQELLAWSWCDTGPDGEDSFESVSVVPADGYEEVWVTVNRGGQRYMERMDHRMKSTAPEDQFFVDWGVTYDGAPATTITGLPYPDGTEVAVLADGNVIANYDNPMTVTSGEITLDVAASKVHIGLPYLADVETLNIDVPMKEGSSQGKRVKVSLSCISVVNTRGGSIGPDFSTLKQIMGAPRSNYTTALALYTGDLKETLGGGYEEGGRVCIRQADPLPFTITRLVPQTTIGGMSGAT